MKMKLNKAIAQVDSMLRRAMENNEFEAPQRLQSLLFILQREYIKELEKTICLDRRSVTRGDRRVS